MGYIIIKISEISAKLNKIDIMISIGITCCVNKRIGIINIENIGMYDRVNPKLLLNDCVVFRLNAK